jgi:hypothetical protein
MNPNLNYKQMSVFGSPDEEAAVIGRSTASYRKAMADDIISKTPDPTGYGQPDSYRRVLERGDLDRHELLVLGHNPPTVQATGHTVHQGNYNPDSQTVSVGTAGQKHRPWTQDVTMAHELGHHLQLGNRVGPLRPNTFETGGDPVWEGVADGFADRVMGHQESAYEEHFNTAQTTPLETNAKEVTLDDGTTAVMSDNRVPYGPGRAMQMYAVSRADARNSRTIPNMKWKEHMGGSGDPWADMVTEQQRLF